MTTPSGADVLAQVERSLARHPRLVLSQIVRVQGSTPGKLGWKMLVRPDGSHFGNLGGGAFEALALRDARRLLEGGEGSRVERYYLTEEAVKGQPTGMVCGGMIEVFHEVLRAVPVLAVCGGGPVGQAVARQGALCDFEVAVLEDREAFRRPELFPNATRTVAVGRDYAGDIFSEWRHRDLYVAVVSRCWETDLAAVCAALRVDLPHLAYLGLMGSRRKVERVERGVVEAGLTLDGVPWHAPIGLQIGGSTPAEIAVSIAAEVVQVRARRSAAGESEGDGDVVAGHAVRLV